MSNSIKEYCTPPNASEVICVDLEYALNAALILGAFSKRNPEEVLRSFASDDSRAYITKNNAD